VLWLAGHAHLSCLHLRQWITIGVDIHSFIHDKGCWRLWESHVIGLAQVLSPARPTRPPAIQQPTRHLLLLLLLLWPPCKGCCAPQVITTHGRVRIIPCWGCCIRIHVAIAAAAAVCSQESRVPHPVPAAAAASDCLAEGVSCC
jgi:hypothetical protein